MKVIGLTGSIGMGKSTVARQFASLDIPVINADDIVHDLLRNSSQVFAEIEHLFPEAIIDGEISRPALGKLVFNNEPELKKLEAILHPRVVEREDRFIEMQKRNGADIAVMDIPLLFETGADKRCDLTIVVTAPLMLQRQRVFKRPGMTEEKFARILSLQMPDKEKRARADYVIQTGLGYAHSYKKVKEIIRDIRHA